MDGGSTGIPPSYFIPDGTSTNKNMTGEARSSAAMVSEVRRNEHESEA